SKSATAISVAAASARFAATANKVAFPFVFEMVGVVVPTNSTLNAFSSLKDSDEFFKPQLEISIETPNINNNLPINNLIFLFRETYKIVLRYIKGNNRAKNLFTKKI